jgi:hypothetical protein
LDDGFVSKGAAGDTMRGPLSVQPLLRATEDDQDLVAVHIAPAFDDAGKQRVSRTALRVTGGSVVFGSAEQPVVTTANGRLAVQGVAVVSDSIVTGRLRVSAQPVDPLIPPVFPLQIGGFGFADGQSPDAGFLRFGDNTGWKFHIARARERSDAGLNSGEVGVLATVTDSGDLGVGTPSPIARLHVVAQTPNFIAFTAISQSASLEYVAYARDVLRAARTPNNTLLIAGPVDDKIQLFWKSSVGTLHAASIAEDAGLTKMMQ